MRFPIPKNSERAQRGVVSDRQSGGRGVRRPLAPVVLGVLLFGMTLLFLFGCEENSAFYLELERIVDEYEAGQEGDAGTAYLDLQAIIQSSQSKHDGAIEGTTVGDYRSGSKASFQTEIDNAATVLNDPASTDPDYDTARTTLNAANTTFDSQIVTDLDVFIFVDITGSMGGPLPGIKTELVTIIQDIDSRNSDARYAVIASHAALVEATGGFVDSTVAITAINGLFAESGGEILIVPAIQIATENYTWTAGSDRIAIFITDSAYDGTSYITETQTRLSSNNIISVACVDSTNIPTDAIALFDGDPLNAYNAIPNWAPLENVGNIIRSVLLNNIAYW